MRTFTHSHTEVDWRERATVSVEEAASILSLGRSAAYIAARCGEIPTLRIGRRLLVPTLPLRRMLGETIESATATNGDALSNTAAGACHDSVYKH